MNKVSTIELTDQVPEANRQNNGQLSRHRRLWGGQGWYNRKSWQGEVFNFCYCMKSVARDGGILNGGELNGCIRELLQPGRFELADDWD